ncbi:MAG: radical SAM protein [Candidatus Aenigmarchaeota archaeon]|nr:radical SAM protein [Candidatus Aenigmarchaeota archaeon]
MDEHEREMYRRILNWFKGKKQPPFKIDLELHRRCNLSCLMCSRRSDPSYERINEYSEKVEIQKKKWLSIIEEAKDLDVREWHVCGGGEPMFLPDVTLSVMESIKEYGALGIITTNGTLWKRRHIEETIRIGWDRVHFSIHAPFAKVHGFLTNCPGTFERVVKTVKIFNELKRKNISDKPEININFVLSVKNYRFLPEMVKFAKLLNANYLFVDPLIVYSELGEKLKLKDKHIREFPKFLEKACHIAEKIGLKNNFSGLDKNLQPELIEKTSRMHEVVKEDVERAKKMKLKGFKRKFLSTSCYKPFFHMTIKCDGRTTSCDVPVTGGDNIRNKSLKEVWNGEYFEDLREKLMNGKVPDFCAQCNPSHMTQKRACQREILKMVR